MSVCISENDRINFKKFGLIEHTCKICGKKFECGAEYIYKTERKHKGTDWFCSWTCYRKDDRDVQHW